MHIENRTTTMQVPFRLRFCLPETEGETHLHQSGENQNNPRVFKIKDYV